MGPAAVAPPTGPAGVALGGSGEHSLDVMADLRLFCRRSLARVHLVVRTVTQLGLPTVGLVAANSARRQVVAWRAAARGQAAAGRMPGRLRSVMPEASGSRLVFEEAELEVHFLAVDVVRLSWGPGLGPVPYAIADDVPWPIPDVETDTLADGGLVLRTAALVVTVDGEGSVRILASGRDRPPQRSPARPSGIELATPPQHATPGALQRAG